MESNKETRFIFSVILLLSIFATYLILENRINQEREYTTNIIIELSEKISYLESSIEESNENIQALIEDNEDIKKSLSALESKISLLESIILTNEIPSDYIAVDFMDFVEVDVVSDWVNIISSNRIDHTTSRTQSTYVYKDYGDSYFGDFTFLFDFSADWADVYTAGCPFVLANGVNDFSSLIYSGDTAIGLRIYYQDEPPFFWIGLHEIYNGEAFSVYFEQGVQNMKYYARVCKNGTLLNCELFSSNALRRMGGSGDIASLFLNLHSNHSFKYLYGASSYKTSSFSLNRNSKLITENMAYKFE